MIPVSALGVDPVLSVSFGTKAIRASGTASKSSKEASRQTFGFDGIRGRPYGARLAREDRPLPHSRAPGSVPWAGPPPTSGRLPEYRLCRCGSTSTLHVRQGPDESMGFNRAPGVLQCRPACRGGPRPPALAASHKPDAPRVRIRSFLADAVSAGGLPRLALRHDACSPAHITSTVLLPVLLAPGCEATIPFLFKGAGSAHEGAS